MKTCERCGQPMSDTADGLCPRCLMSAAVGSGAPEAITRKLTSTPELPDIADAAEIARRLPQFEIVELLGRGGMGVVYKARQVQLDRTVALKILPPADALSPDFVERFRREARSLAKLSHPNIVHVYDFGEAGGLYYFVMEFVDGVNLREMLRTQRMTPPEALAVVPKICDALQFAHEEGVVHRDIKPENILIDRRGRVKIADFGLAKLLRRDATDATLTQSGMTLGTPRYMAPEQLDKPESVDHRADIYSLGVVFYEMLTGEIPMGRFAPPSEKVQVDVKLDEIVLRSLERDVERRYQHASEVRDDVENFSGILDKLPPVLRRQLGFDFKSSRTLFGMPLVHVAMGIDPATGKSRVARGIVAIGGKAVGGLAVGGSARGVVAIGGVATGVFAFGGLSCGIVSLGGLAFGVIAMGGLALGLGLAHGGGAIAPIAFGGGAIGYIAGGGAAFGPHATSATHHDALAGAVMQRWSGPIMTTFWVLFAFAMVTQFVAQGWAWWAQRRLASAGAGGALPGGELPTRSLLASLLAVALAALISGLVFIRPAPSSRSDTPKIRVDHSQIPTTRTPGRTDYAYAFTVPANHRLFVWLEWWKDGKRSIDQNFNTGYIAKPGQRYDAGVQLVFTDGNVAGPATAGQTRIDWIFSKPTGHGSSGNWRPDFFAGLMTTSSWGEKSTWSPKAGETVTLLAIAGRKDSVLTNPITDYGLRAGHWQAAMLLKARVEPVPESRMPIAPETKMNAWNDNEDPSPALLRLGEQFGATPGPFATAANHREQIAYRIKKDTVARAKAEQMLRDKGVLPDPDATPEDLIRTLENLP